MGKQDFELSDEGAGAMVHFEGNVLHVYLDQAGKETIGIGHLLSPDERMTGRFPGGVQAYRDSQGRWAISAEQSRSVFRFDLGRFARDLSAAYKGPRELEPHEADALILWDFNTGGLFGSGVLAALNEGRYDDVPGEMLRWNHIRDRYTGALVVSPDLTMRRKAEVAIWLNGYEHPQTQVTIGAAAVECYARQFTTRQLLGDGFDAPAGLDDAPETPKNT